MTAMLEVKDLHVHYGMIEALKGVSLKVEEGQIVSLIGANGAGKTTLLQSISGIVKKSAGDVVFLGQDIYKMSPQKIVALGLTQVPEGRRIFTGLSVYENLMMGAYLRKDKKGIEEDIQKIYKQFPILEQRKNQDASTLSGGEQQMLAMGRALMSRPKILLLDEPLGALDLKLRHGMQRELIKIKQEVGITFVYVTHDQEEALTMSDRIVVMNKGIIQQMGTSKSIYDEPQNAFVADFIGDSNIIDGIMKEDCLVQIQNVPIPCVDTGFAKDELVDVVIRPEDLVIVKEEDGYLKGMVVSIIFKGAYYEIKVRVGHYDWIVQSVNPAQIGTVVGMTILPDNIQIMHKPHSEDAEVVREDA